MIVENSLDMCQIPIPMLTRTISYNFTVYFPTQNLSSSQQSAASFTNQRYSLFKYNTQDLLHVASFTSSRDARQAVRRVPQKLGCQHAVRLETINIIMLPA